MGMKHKIQNLLLLFFCAVTSVNAAFQAGMGSKEAPYHIANPQQLDSIRYFPTAHFVLDNDIDLDVAPYNTGEGWNPIPNISNYFIGSLNGRGHVLHNLMINRPTEGNVGLFSQISNATIDSLGLIGVSIEGQSSVGAIVGSAKNATVIHHSFATGHISGTQNQVGGLAGSISEGASIKDAYAVVNVKAPDIVGGLVGSLYNATIYRSYAAGEVVSVKRTQGGLLGQFYAKYYNYKDTIAKVVDCFYNQETTTLQTGKYGKALSTENMVMKGSFANWDFTGVWSIVEGETYPSLRSFPSQKLVLAVENQEPTVATVQGNGVYFAGDVPTSTVLRISDILVGYSFAGWEIAGKVVSSEPEYTIALDGFTHVKAKLTKVNADFGGGFGTMRNPYLIKTPTHLNNLRKYGSDTLEWALVNDIDLAVAPYNTGEGWTPIPKFVGYLNGRGFAVKNMMIHKPTKDSVGFIADYETYLGIDSLGMLNVDIQGDSILGGIAGVMGSYKAPIRFCYVSGKMRAQKGLAGGVVGYMDNYGLVQFAAVNIDLESTVGAVGGVVGETQYGGSIQQSYSLGRVKSSGAAGGILGYVYYEGKLSDNYSLATVEGGKYSSILTSSNYAGGIAGIVSDGDRDTQHFIYVDRNYYVGSNLKVVGLDDGFFNVAPRYNYVGAEVTKNKATYSQWNFDTTWTIKEGKEYPRLRGTYQFTHPVVSSSVRSRPAPMKLNSIGLRRFDLLGRVFN